VKTRGQNYMGLLWKNSLGNILLAAGINSMPASGSVF